MIKTALKALQYLCLLSGYIGVMYSFDHVVHIKSELQTNKPST